MTTVFGTKAPPPLTVKLVQALGSDARNVPALEDKVRTLYVFCRIERLSTHSCGIFNSVQNLIGLLFVPHFSFRN